MDDTTSLVLIFVCVVVMVTALFAQRSARKRGGNRRVAALIGAVAILAAVLGLIGVVTFFLK